MRARSSWRSRELRCPARGRTRAVQGGRGLQAPELPGSTPSRTHQDARTRRGRDSLLQQLSRSLKRALDEFGAGTGSVRFICGTFTIHRELEQALARFVGCESSLTYVSCWNANEGLVSTLLGEQDIVISDQLNHASIIDAIRLAKTITKCQTAVYRHSDMADLEEQLKGGRD